MSSDLSCVRAVNPAGGSPPRGSYSPGILVPLPGADLLFVTGQVAVSNDGSVIAPNDMRAQAEVVFQNIGRVLAEAGLGFEHVVKAQIFVTNIKEFALVSEVRNKYFATSKPASTMVEVTRLAREGCCVEVEVIAVRVHGQK